MDKNSTKEFINKAIEKTKAGELDWSILSATVNLKPLPEDDSGILKLGAFDALYQSYSYYSRYGNGEILLLVFSGNSILVSPPDNCFLSLRMQDARSKYAVEVENNKHDTDTAIMLSRLYNLIDKDVSSVNSLINDFLNS